MTKKKKFMIDEMMAREDLRFRNLALRPWNFMEYLDQLENKAIEPKFCTTVQSIASGLQDVLTQKLTAYIVGLSDGLDMGRYVRGEKIPDSGTDKKLRDLHSLVSDFLKVKDSETIQVWFLGKNPELENDSPANILHSGFMENYLRVMGAADKFVAGEFTQTRKQLPS